MEMMDDFTADNVTKLDSLKDILQKNQERIDQITEVETQIAVQRWLWKSLEDISNKSDFKDIFHREIYNTKKALHQIENKYNENKFEIEKKRIQRQSSVIVAYIESNFPPEVIEASEVRQHMTTDDATTKAPAKKQAKSASSAPPAPAAPVMAPSPSVQPVQILLNEKALELVGEKAQEILAAKAAQVLEQHAQELERHAHEVLAAEAQAVVNDKAQQILAEKTQLMLQRVQDIIDEKSEETISSKAAVIISSKAQEIINEKAQVIVTQKIQQVLQEKKAQIQAEARELVVHKAMEVLTDKAQEIVSTKAEAVLFKNAQGILQWAQDVLTEISRGICVTASGEAAAPIEPERPDEKAKKGKAKGKGKGKGKKEPETVTAVETTPAAAAPAIDRERLLEDAAERLRKILEATCRIERPEVSSQAAVSPRETISGGELSVAQMAALALQAVAEPASDLEKPHAEPETPVEKERQDLTGVIGKEAQQPVEMPVAEDEEAEQPVEMPPVAEEEAEQSVQMHAAVEREVEGPALPAEPGAEDMEDRLDGKSIEDILDEDDAELARQEQAKTGTAADDFSGIELPPDNIENGEAQRTERRRRLRRIQI